MSDDRDRNLGVVLLSLCPAAAVSTRVLDALLLSAGTVLVLAATAVLLAVLRGIAPGGRGLLWGTLLLSSCFTAVFELALRAAAPAVSSRLGIYVPLIAVSLLIMGRLDAMAGEASPGRALLDSLLVGSGFAGLLVVVALAREILGAGSLTLGGAVAAVPILDDPARGLEVAGGALICLGYAAGALRLARGRRGDEGREDGP